MKEEAVTMMSGLTQKPDNITITGLNHEYHYFIFTIMSLAVPDGTHNPLNIFVFKSPLGEQQPCTYLDQP